jgi:hypothetical protein
MRISRVTWFLALCLAGCGSAPASSAAPTPPTPAPEESPSGGPGAEHEQAAKEPTPAAPAAAVPPTAAAPASDVVNDPAFTLSLIQAGPYKAGELGRFVLQLEPHGKFHINQEYPFEASFTTGADTTLPKAKLERADAAEFALKKARFEVPFTAKVAGDQHVNANVKFAVCTDENCVPDERNLTLALAVK